MPELPDKYSLGARPTPRQARPIQGYQVIDNGGQEAGRRIFAFGEGLEKKQDALNILDAERKLDDWETSQLFDPQAGAFTTQGKNALGVSTKYTTNFDTYSQEIGKTLTSDAQRTAFQSMLNDRRKSVERRLMSHEKEQADVYEKEVIDTDGASTLNFIAMNYNQPVAAERLNSWIQTSKNYQLKKGRGQEAADLAAATARSKGLSLIIGKKLESQDPKQVAEAEKMYKQMIEKNQFMPDDLDNVSKMLMTTKPLVAAKTEIKRTVAVGSADTIDPDAFFNQGILMAESSGKQFSKDGTVVTSPKGAKGIAQVMPSAVSEVAKKWGVDPATINVNDAATNKEVGAEYFYMMREQFNGSNTLAAMAYNAGPTAVKGLIDKVGDPTKGEIPMEDFVNRFTVKEDGSKNETGKYLDNIKQFAGAVDYLPSPTETARIAQQKFPDDPEAAETYVSGIENLRVDQAAAKRAAKDNVFSNVQQQMFSFRGDLSKLDPLTKLEATKAGIDLKKLPMVSDTQVTSELDAMAPERLASTDLTTDKYRYGLAFPEYTAYKEKQKTLMQVKSPEYSLEKQIDDVAQTFFTTYVPNAKLEGNSTAAQKQKGQLALMKNYLRDQSAALTQAGTPITPKVINTLAATYINNLKASRDSTTSTAQALTTDISDKKRREIVSLLQEAGYLVTDDNIRRYVVDKTFAVELQKLAGN